MTNRRSFLLGIGAALAAPAIVRAESLMKVAVLRETVPPLLLEAEVSLVTRDIYREFALYIYGRKEWQFTNQQLREMLYA